MSGHRALTDNYLADTTVEDPGDAGTISIDRNPAIVELVSTEAGGETRTLADPRASGRVLPRDMKTDGGDIVVTASTAYDENGSTTITFANTGEFVKFVSIPDPASSGDYVWRVTSYDGATGPTINLANIVVDGFRNTNVVLQVLAAAEDLTATTENLVWYATTTQAGNITLPQATAANAGMVIKIIAGATWSTTAFKLGFASGGSTVMVGTLRVSALDAVLTTSFAVTASAKNLVIDADEVSTAGGAQGSTYTFTYLAANLVHVTADAYITTGTVATTAASSVTGGI